MFDLLLWNPNARIASSLFQAFVEKLLLPLMERRRVAFEALPESLDESSPFFNRKLKNASCELGRGHGYSVTHPSADPLR